MSETLKERLERKQEIVRDQLKFKRFISNRKIKRDKVDYNTLHTLYISHLLPVNEIARRIDRTRARVWQLLKEYNLHDKNRKQVVSICAYCGQQFNIVQSKANKGFKRYCCAEHYHEHRRVVGGHKENRHGRRIARKKIKDWLGFPLPPSCVVHHEDGDCLNNDLNNIYVFPSHAEHLKYHHAKRHGTAVLPYTELWELAEKVKEW